jgi:galactitol-specific phosphotransferase system IIB component
MKTKVNILFVCGYGVGSSVMLQSVVQKALKKYSFEFEMEHTAAGEVGGLYRLGRYLCYF